jgi:hypothetical protein
MANLDQFYTRPEIAKECCDLIDFSKYSSILEPSAGTGAFLPFLPEDKVTAIDLEPIHPSIEQRDFFEYKEKHDLIIGNPPFGRVSSLAIKFFNHAATLTNTIAFIIPRTFRRVSVQNKINLEFHLILDHEVPMGSFIPSSMKAKCCFQLWERKKYSREKIKLPLTHEDFIAKSYITINGKVHAPDDVDFAIRAYGSNIGQISFDIEQLAPKSWHFIKAINESCIDIFPNLDYYPMASWTARQDSIGKADLIYLYNKYMENTNG